MKQKAVAPIIATLILVAIAVVGGVMIFVLSQEFYSLDSMNVPKLAVISMVGYDARDLIAPPNCHDGTACAGVAANTGTYPLGNAAAGAAESIAIYIKNHVTHEVGISGVMVSGTALTAAGAVPSCTEFNVFETPLAGGPTAFKADNRILPGDTASIVITFWDGTGAAPCDAPAFKVAKDRPISIKVTTDSDQEFGFIVVMGSESGGIGQSEDSDDSCCDDDDDDDDDD